MFCPRCGAESPDDVRYCGACGAELPKLDGAAAADGGESRRTRMVRRLQRLVGRTRRERVISGITAGLLLVAVVGFIALDPAEDEETSAARDALDAACVAAKAQVVEAANALAGEGGAGQYAVRVVIAMMDLRDAATQSAIDGAAALDDAAFEAAVAAGRFGRLAREDAPAAEVSDALEESTAALDALSAPTEDLGLSTCAGTSIDNGE